MTPTERGTCARFRSGLSSRPPCAGWRSQGLLSSRPPRAGWRSQRRVARLGWRVGTPPVWTGGCSDSSRHVPPPCTPDRSGCPGSAGQASLGMDTSCCDWSLVQADTGQVVKGSLWEWTRHVVTGHLCSLASNSGYRSDCKGVTLGMYTYNCDWLLM